MGLHNINVPAPILIWLTNAMDLRRVSFMAKPWPSKLNQVFEVNNDLDCSGNYGGSIQT